MRKQKRIIITCPYCGTTISKSQSMEDTEMQCGKCRSNLLVNYKNNVLTVREHQVEYATSK